MPCKLGNKQSEPAAPPTQHLLPSPKIKKTKAKKKIYNNNNKKEDHNNWGFYLTFKGPLFYNVSLGLGEEDPVLSVRARIGLAI